MSKFFIISFEIQYEYKVLTFVSYRIAWRLLYTLLLSASAGVLLHSSGMIPNIPTTVTTKLSTLLRPVSAGMPTPMPSTSLASSTLWSRTAAQLTRTLTTVPASTLWSRTLSALRLTTPIAATTTATVTQNAQTIIPVTTMTSRIAHTAVSTVLVGMAWDVQHRAQSVDPEQPKQVFAYYMHIWNIFYACYILLPLLRL